ncbi:MAG: single-stranded-DNA-specific exonuclease RecJ, partial [Bacteroidales bacterium]
LGFFIPDRYLDGYGLSKRGIDYAANHGVTLMIVLDCGIKAHEQVLYAKSKGIDVIIGDHHRPGDTLPDAFAVLDPKRNDCEYPYKELSGCGVGFKLIQAYALQHDMDVRKNVYPLLDLVAVSIASDIVPLTDENRILSYFGLMLLNTHPRPGIETILNYSKVKRNSFPTLLAKGCNKPLYFNKELTNNDLVFFVGPRINAAGRMECGKNAVQLLLCKNLQEAEEIGKNINSFNTERKSLDHLATEEALTQIEQNELLQTRYTTVVFDKSWNQGVIGIVASRLTESYYRPTIVFTESKSEEMLVGSARSIKGFDIYDAIEACGDLLEHFGGHKYAAGLSIRPENFEKFSEAFEQIVTETLQNKQMVPEIEIDDEVPFSDITNEFFEELKKFAPFGPKNMNPIFKSVNVRDAGPSRRVGNNHLKLSLFQADTSSYPLNGIAFQQGDSFEDIKSGQPFSICYHIEENEWNGTISTQLNIKDIKFN